MEGEDCKADEVGGSCYGKTMIEVINQNLEVAKFLNLDIPTKLDDDMKRLCNSAKAFQKDMVIAHEKGLRVMTAYLTTGTSYFATPIHDPVLRMLEELGMPLLHVGACTNTTTCPFTYFWEWLPIDEYFTDCAAGEVSAKCNENTLYPVDFWLYDHRTTLSITNEDFQLGFPDRAIIEKQYDYWPIGGRLITPHHAANILDQLGPSLANAERLNPVTECTPAKVSATGHRTDGLVGGEYACYDETEHNSLYFANCAVVEPTTAPVSAPFTTTAARVFVDDLGEAHISDKEKPTIVTWAHRAVSLSHYGLDTGQLLGTYGEWANSGSDYDFDKPELGSSFPADPTPEEMRLLAQVTNLSPGCGAEYCTEFNTDVLEALAPDFLLIHGYRHSPWASSDELAANITRIMGDRVIYTDVSMEGEDCKADEVGGSCYGKTMIEVINQNLEVAKFLNLDIPTKLDDDMKRLCNSAKAFQKDMVIAHEKGLRVMTAYLTTGTSYFATPIHDPVLRMLEELGMPLLHVGACTNTTTCPFTYFWEWLPIDEYFTDCAAGEVSAKCNENTLYPVDFWLYDHRTTLSITNEDFQLGFPDRAIIEKQYDYWPIGGRLITPHHAANILDQLGPSLANAERLNPVTECTPAKVSATGHRTDGLVGGEYACYDETEHNSLYFEKCATPEPTSEPTSEPVTAPITPLTISQSPDGTPESSANTVLVPAMAMTIMYSFMSLMFW